MLRLSDARMSGTSYGAWSPPPRRFERGYGWMISRRILQADEGCDFDFLEASFGAPVGEPAIY